MVFISWGKPSKQRQKDCLNRSNEFNYVSKYRGLTSNLNKNNNSDVDNDSLGKDGFFVNHSRVPIGSGFDTFNKAKSALLHWRHFGLGWAFVNEDTQIKNGVKFCACVKEFLPWVMMPLQVVYVNDTKPGSKRNKTALFSFGSGTLQGHLLAGEERFLVEMDENEQVWYEILSFSKPAHFLSAIGYPYVQFRQKVFAKQSTNAVLKHVTSSLKL